MRTFFLFALLSVVSHCVHAQIITTVAGTGSAGYSGDGSMATVAQLNSPYGVAIDGSGNVYIADYYNSRIRKVNASGNITTFAGTGSPGYSGDGANATAAQLSNPKGIAVDRSGNVYIADGNNRIRRVSPAGIITTIAGTGSAGYNGDGGAATAAQLSVPSSVAADGSGNVYIADNGNHRIRRVSASGIISTIAGTGSAGYSGDGGAATAAQLDYPAGVALDGSGNVYIADNANQRIRTVSPGGIINTIAGISSFGYSGDGAAATAARLYSPSGIAVDGGGNVYFADLLNHRVRRVSSSGIITTIAGTGTGGYSGDGVTATAQLFWPRSVAVDGSGNAYIADYGNHRIRKVSAAVSAITFPVSGQDANLFRIYPNPVGDIITVAAKGNTPISKLVIYDISGREAGRYTPETTKAEIDMSGLATGTYILRIFSGESRYQVRVVKE